jgi:peptidoglycan/xylan/chitin deacetylase (PgdA/CDA1 family)
MKKFFLLILAVFFFSGCSYSKVSILNHIENSKLGQNPILKKFMPDNINNNTDSKEPAEKVLILMYHYVRKVEKEDDPLGYKLSVDPDALDQQLKWLKENGYHGLSTKDIIEKKITKKSVILSFDDGYEDFYTEAFPRLKKYGFSATCAIIINQIDAPNYLSRDQIKELVSFGIEIVSHSMSHADMTSLDDSQLENELKTSKDTLENEFGINVETFVYPYGRFDENVDKKLKDFGYSLGITTKSGTASYIKNPYELPRRRIDNRDSFDGFVKKIQTSNL